MIIGTAKKKKTVLFSVLWALKLPMAIRVNLFEFFSWSVPSSFVFVVFFRNLLCMFQVVPFLFRPIKWLVTFVWILVKFMTQLFFTKPLQSHRHHQYTTGWKTLDRLTLNLSTFLPFVLWNLSEGSICMFLCRHLAFIFRVVTGWKRELSRSKQIKLIQQSYLTFETENFSCPVSSLTWKSPIVSSFSSFSRFALFCFFEMGFTFRVSQGQRKANEYWSLNKEMIKNVSKIYQVIFLKFQN